MQHALKITEFILLFLFQCSDLLGAVGYPLKISRTVVSGQSLSAVSRLLHLLTYFIRCSEVEPGFTPVRDSRWAAVNWCI